MMYAGIKYNDVANGEGVRTTLFVSGCGKRCKGCHNPEAQSFIYGEPFTPKTVNAILESLSKPWISGLTICGGEPLHPFNGQEVAELAEFVKLHFPDKNIWCYTGYKFEEVPKTLLNSIDVLVDGEYIESLRDPGLWYRGSSNQRIIDVQQSLKKGKVICV